MNSPDTRRATTNAFLRTHEAFRVSSKGDTRRGTLPSATSYVDEPRLASLKATESTLKGISVLSPEETHTTLTLLKEPESLASLLSTTTREIAARTTALRETQELSQLCTRTVEGGKRLDELVTEEWGTQVIIEGVAIDGFYSHDDRTVRISEPYPTMSEMLTSFATVGRAPSIVILGNHEWLHAAQLNLGNPDAPKELLEAHGYRSQPYSHTEAPPNVLIDIISTHEAYRHLDPSKFEYAVWSIDRLMALGYSHEAIIGIIGNPGAWNQKQKLWGNIQSAIAATMTRKGIDETGLERRVMENDLRKRIAQEEARLITQQILREERLRMQGKPIPVFDPARDVVKV